jgi:hypothetical protein
METSSTQKKNPTSRSNTPSVDSGRLAKRDRFSVQNGDLLWLDGHWYVSHSGLIRLARRNHCSGIHVEPVSEFSDPSTSRWAFKATVYKSRTCRGFVGYGDADPSNVSPLVRGAEMRVAETRAVRIRLRNFLHRTRTAMATVQGPRFGTVYARSYASTSSTPNS